MTLLFTTARTAEPEAKPLNMRAYFENVTGPGRHDACVLVGLPTDLKTANFHISKLRKEELI
jgi:hypothetical protein